MIDTIVAKPLAILDEVHKQFSYRMGTYCLEVKKQTKYCNDDTNITLDILFISRIVCKG